jgi:hypothetical protein
MIKIHVEAFLYFITLFTLFISNYLYSSDPKKIHECQNFIQSKLPIKHAQFLDSQIHVYVKSDGTPKFPFPANVALYYNNPTIKCTWYRFFTLCENNDGSQIRIREDITPHHPDGTKYFKNNGNLPDACKYKFNELKKAFENQPEAIRQPITQKNQNQYKALFTIARNLVKKHDFAQVAYCLKYVYAALFLV